MQILSTKLLIPPLRPGLVTRLRLFQKLNQGVECGFVLVSAPAGYGKSTLLSDWLNQVRVPHAWLSLDQGDNDPNRFLAYLAAALNRIDPSIEAPGLGGLPSQSPLEIEPRLTPLINAVARIKSPAILVLDEYQLIQNQAVHQMLAFLLENRPHSLRLVIATRADPPIPLSRLRGRSQVMELRLADLRFSSAEIREFLRQGMALDLSEEDVGLLETSTEGWIAGLQMAGLSLQGRADASSFIRSFSGENRYILDFLFEEVFQHQPADIQDFLLQTSILERLCAPLCNAVTLQENSQAVLERLDRGNLFLVSLDEQRWWYRYHHLFSDLLKNRLRRSSPILEAQLHRRASAWFSAERSPESAVAHALAAQDHELAADLIEQAARGLDMQNQQALLASWVDRLPCEVMETHPWLCVYRAWGCYWTGHREMEEQWLSAAERSIDNGFAGGEAEKKHILGHIATVRAMAALTLDDLSTSLEMAHKALEFLPAGDEMRNEANMALGSILWGRGDVIASEKAFLAARAELKNPGYASMVVGPTAYAGLQQVKQGRIQQAIATLQDSLRMGTLPDGSETPIAGFPLIRLGDVYRELNDLGQASDYLRRGLEQCIRFNQPDVLTDAYVCLGRYHLSAGDLESVWENLGKADRIARQVKVDQWVVCSLNDCRLRAWLKTGNLDAASQWAQTSGLSPDGELSYLYDLHHQNLARVLVAQGIQAGSIPAREEASLLLARLLVAARQAGWVREEISFRVLQAINLHAQGLDQLALQSLACAVWLAEPGGFVRIFLDEGERTGALLAALAENMQHGDLKDLAETGIHVQAGGLERIKDYISRLLAAFKQPAAYGSPAPGSVLIEPLSGRELEVLKLLAQGCADKKIAEKLVIARETVHKHLKNIYGKLAVHNRTEAVVHARELGLV